MSKTTDSATAFLIGMLTGGVIALLLAPEKGQVTREKIRKGATDAYDKSRDWVDHTQHDVRERIGGVTEKTKEKVQGVAGAAKGQIDAVRGAVAEGKDAYRREMDQGGKSET